MKRIRNQLMIMREARDLRPTLTLLEDILDTEQKRLR